MQEGKGLSTHACYMLAIAFCLIQIAAIIAGFYLSSEKCNTLGCHAGVRLVCMFTGLVLYSVIPLTMSSSWSENFTAYVFLQDAIPMCFKCIECCVVTCNT